MEEEDSNCDTIIFNFWSKKEIVCSLQGNVFLSPPEPQHELGHNLVMLGQNTWGHVASQVSLHHILSLYSHTAGYINQLSNQTHVFLYQAQEDK